MSASRFAAAALAAGLLSSLGAVPARAEAPPLIAAPPAAEPGWLDARLLLDLGVASAASAGVLGLLVWDGGTGPIGRLGPLGQAAMVLAAVTVPPAVMVSVRQETFDSGAYLSALPAGVVGLGLGFAAMRPWLTTPAMGMRPDGLALTLGLGTTALGQGLGSAIGARLFDRYRDSTDDLDRLPETRTDDPIDNWNLKRERQQR